MYLYRPGGRCEQISDEPEKRALSTARWTDERDKLSLPDREIDVRQSQELLALGGVHHARAIHANSRSVRLVTRRRRCGARRESHPTPSRERLAPRVLAQSTCATEAGQGYARLDRDTYRCPAFSSASSCRR